MKRVRANLFRMIGTAIQVAAALSAPIILSAAATTIYWYYDANAPVLAILDDLPPPVEYPQMRERAVDEQGHSQPFVVVPFARQGDLIVAGWPLAKLRYCPGGIVVSAVATTRNFATALSEAPATLPKNSRGWFYFGYTVPTKLCPGSYRLSALARHSCNPLKETIAVLNGPVFHVTGDEYAHCKAFRLPGTGGAGGD